MGLRIVRARDLPTGHKSVVLDVNLDAWQLFRDTWLCADNAYKPHDQANMEYLEDFIILVDTTSKEN